MAARYDLVVIGTGTAASVAAKRCRAAGWSVAVIDERPCHAVVVGAFSRFAGWAEPEALALG